MASRCRSALAPRARHGALAASLAAAIAVSAGAVAQAQDSASPLHCSGHSALDQTQDPADNSVIYSFGCSGKIASFAIVGSKEIDSFSTTADVAAAGQPNGESFNCEGSIPGVGFGCLNTSKTKPAIAGGGNAINGSLTTGESPCLKGKPRLRLWVVAVGSDGKATEPIGLIRPDCPQAQSQSKRHLKTKRHGAKRHGARHRSRR